MISGRTSNNYTRNEISIFAQRLLMSLVSIFPPDNYFRLPESKIDCEGRGNSGKSGKNTEKFRRRNAAAGGGGFPFDF